MSASASESSSNPTTNTQSLSTQGAAGANSPTLTGGNDVTYNDPTIALQAIQQAGSTILAALNNESGLNSQVAQQGAQQQSSNSDLIYQILQNEQNLAAAEGTGGASITATSTNYLIWGGIGIAAIALFAIFFGKRN
jgi:hypothetical protein